MKLLNDFEELQGNSTTAPVTDKKGITDYDSQSVIDAMQNNEKLLNTILDDLHQHITSH